MSAADLDEQLEKYLLGDKEVANEYLDDQLESYMQKDEEEEGAE